MPKDLVITEKPSVARDVVAALGGFEEHDGYWESDDYVVSFAVGHLYELKAPEDLDPKYKRWTLDTLPIIPEVFELKPKSEHRDRLKILNALLARSDVDHVVNACDAGREGELIFREILEASPKSTTKPVRRLWLQSMTEAAIRSGFGSLADGVRYQGLRDAAFCRTYSDWLIGMNATRALTRRLKSRTENQAWSAGRVQTPTLAMLVDRELEVLEHVPEAFYRIEAEFEHPSHAYRGVWYDPELKAPEGDEKLKPERLFDKARAEAVLAKIQGKPGAASETRKPSREAAPPLFDLTSLQREANRRFGWSARRTLNAAQRCYEAHKILTYPRTDTKALPKDYVAVVEDVVRSLRAEPRFSDAAKYLEKHGLMNKERTFDDAKVTDHFAIVPTGVLPSGRLDGDDGKLFDLVARRFLAAFHPPALWVQVKRNTVVEGEHFRSRAKLLQEPGWRAVLGETEAEESDGPLPPLAPGKDEANDVPVAPREAALTAEETKPAPRITEGRLLSLMENAGQQVEDEDAALALKDKGIGTPATRADIIENLIRKEYVVRAGKVLRPTVKGIRLIDVLRRMHADRLASPALTGEMEQHLLEVERQRRAASAFMDEIRDYTRDIVDRTKNFEFQEIFPDVDPLGPCPICGGVVYERSWFYRCKERPEGEEDCPFRIWKDKAGRYIDRTTVRQLLAEKKTRVLEGFATRSGRFYKGMLEIEGGQLVLKSVQDGDSEDGGTEAPEYEVDDSPLGPCPVCKESEVVETRATFVCRRGRDVLRSLSRDEASLFPLKKKEIPEGVEYCPFVLPRTVCRREVTREEALVYLRDGRTAQLSDFISHRGRPFSAILVLADTGRHSFEFPPRAPRGGKAAEAGADGAEANAPEKAAKKPGKKAAKKVAKKAAKKGAKKGTEPAAEKATKPATKKATKKRASKKKATTKRKASKPSAAAPVVESVEGPTGGP